MNPPELTSRLRRGFLLRLTSVFFSHTLVTVLFFTLGVKSLTPGDILGSLGFILVWDTLVLLPLALVQFHGFKKSWTPGAGTQTQKQLKKLTRGASLAAGLIGLVFVLVIGIMGTVTEAQAYKSWARILEFTFSVCYAYIILPVFILQLLMENFTRNARKLLNQHLGLEFQSGQGSLAWQLFGAFTVVSLYPLTTVFLSLGAHGLLDQLLVVNPYLISYFIIIFLAILMIIFLRTRSFSQSLNNLSQLVHAIGRGEFQHRLPVTEDHELGTLTAQVNAMAEGLQDREKIRDVLGKVVDPRIRDRLLSGGLNLGGEVRELTVLFSDIRGFTTLAETLNPRDVVDLLNRIFERMNTCIMAQGGVVNKYIGDAVLAIFGLGEGNDAQAALQAAAAMKQALSQLNQEFAAQGLSPVAMGIGIHRGPVLLGNIGSSQRMEFTVIGDTVNTASRIEGLTKLYAHGAVVTSQVLDALPQDAPAEGRFLLDTPVRGRREPLPLFEIFSGLDPEEIQSLRETLPAYTEALRVFKSGQISAALPLFENLSKLRPQDKIFAHWLQVCRTETPSK